MDEAVAQPILSAAERTHRAKRFDEALKLAATLLTSSAIAPRHRDLFSDGGWTVLIAAVVQHPMGQIVIGILRPEE